MMQQGENGGLEEIMKNNAKKEGETTKNGGRESEGRLARGLSTLECGKRISQKERHNERERLGREKSIHHRQITRIAQHIK